MNEEIKEILDKLKDNDWYEELDLTGTKWIELKQEETNQLLNYITNLQEENNKLKETNKEHRKINGQLREENDLLREKLIQIEDVMWYKHRQTKTQDDCETYNALFR